MAHVPRVLIAAELQSGAAHALDAERAHHLHTVLRRASGDQVRVWNGRGQEADATLTQLNHKRAQVELGSVEHRDRESPLQLVLAQAVSRGDRFEAALAASIELGATAIQPLWTEHGLARLPAERLQRKCQGWAKLVLGAAEQAERSILPALEAPQALREWVSSTPAGILLDPSGTPLDRSALQQRLRTGVPLCVAVGPEGGFSPGELDSARAAGWQILRLGPRILRTEHAGPALLAACQALAGDWSGVN